MQGILEVFNALLFKPPDFGLDKFRNVVIFML